MNKRDKNNTLRYWKQSFNRLIFVVSGGRKTILKRKTKTVHNLHTDKQLDIAVLHMLDPKNGKDFQQLPPVSPGFMNRVEQLINRLYTFYKPYIR